MLITDLEKSPYIYTQGVYEYYFSTQTRLGGLCKNKDKEVEKLKARFENISRMPINILQKDLLFLVYKRFQPDFQLVKKAGQNLNYSEMVINLENDEERSE